MLELEEKISSSKYGKSPTCQIKGLVWGVLLEMLSSSMPSRIPRYSLLLVCTSPLPCIYHLLPQRGHRHPPLSPLTGCTSVPSLPNICRPRRPPPPSDGEAHRLPLPPPAGHALPLLHGWRIGTASLRHQTGILPSTVAPLPSLHGRWKELKDERRVKLQLDRAVCQMDEKFQYLPFAHPKVN